MSQEVDWSAVETEYRTGQPLRAIAEKYGINHMAIARRAKRDGWVKDLTARIAAKADEIVTREAVTKDVTEKRAVTDRIVVEANATAQAAAILEQRKDVQKARATVRKLFAQADIQIDLMDDLERLGEFMADPDEHGRDKLNDLYRKVIDLPSRIDGAKKLSEAMKTLIELERKVLRIKDDDAEQKAAENISAIVRKVVDPKVNGT